MYELNNEEIMDVSGGRAIISVIGNEAGYGASLGAAGAFLGMGLAIASAPAWVPFAMFGASIAASGLAINYALGG